MHEYRTNNCGELTIKDSNKQVKLSGWIQRIRNLGAMRFIDLRDEFGITQIVVQNSEEMEKICAELTTESCICVEGTVVERTNKNEKIPTGEIEVIAQEIKVL